MTIIPGAQTTLRMVSALELDFSTLRLAQPFQDCRGIGYRVR